MKRPFLFLLTLLITFTAFAQTFKKNDIVEIDSLLSDAKEGIWQRGVVIAVDTVSKKYIVMLSSGDKKVMIPVADPEKWIRPVVGGSGLNQYGQGVKFVYQARNKAINAYRCNPSEAGMQKNIQSLLMQQFKDYQFINVEYTSFKAQNGYEDKNFKGQQVYPYKIEMLVHLKRTIYVRGKPFSEYQTWKYDRVYEYASRPKNKCECHVVGMGEEKLLFRGWY